MADTSAADASLSAGDRNQAQRSHLQRVTIDTTALLNIVKHCREADYKTGAQGNLMGVIKDGLGEQTLMITQSMPYVSKISMQELTEAMENES